MTADISNIKTGLAIVLIGLFFSVGLGISFGLYEGAYQDFIAQGIAANPDVHNDSSGAKIWRYALRTHFHAGGIAAFCLGLVILVVFSNMSTMFKRLSSTLIALGSLYPLSWMSMLVLAPGIGTRAAHNHFLTIGFTYIGVGGLLLGSFFLVANLYLDRFR